MSHPPTVRTPVQLDWQRIHTVLLDMDGTLLDLRFDNYFWAELIPQRWGERHGLSLAEAQAALRPRFVARHGTLEWYCTDFWSRELGLNIAQLKVEARQHIGYLPGAEAFLTALRHKVARVVLATNAHPDAVAVKAAHTGLAQHFDAVISAHELGHPKEAAPFWPQLQQQLQLAPERTLFVDDNLAVLRAARDFGIGQVVAIAKPDSTQPARPIDEFQAVESVAQLL